MYRGMMGNVCIIIYIQYMRQKRLSLGHPHSVLDVLFIKPIQYNILYIIYIVKTIHGSNSNRQCPNQYETYCKPCNIIENELLYHQTMEG